jgi:DNA-binding NtrC family response regulator
MGKAHALVVDDDPNTLEALAELVALEGFETSTAPTLEAARERIPRLGPDVVLCDLILPDGKGTELLEEYGQDSAIEIILVTGNATVDSAVEALRLGAYDYLTKPVDVKRLKTLLAGVRRTLELKREVSTLRGELRRLGRFGPLVGTSKVMQGVYDLIERVAPTAASVFLVGESGTGKELAAAAVHQLSPRRRRPFLPLNCGAVSATLIESELFGHERGSFTGASRQHKGYFERASGGTLFLDEVTEMPIELQVKLLRVLETARVVRVGGTDGVDVDVRVIAATNSEPDEAVSEGRLREDLYYRLKVFPIRLPPLRDREGDLELLALHFLDRLNELHDTKKRIVGAVFERLAEHAWPGNVRELKNVIERAFILADDEITPELLPAELEGAGAPSGPYVRVKVGASLEEAEKRLILATLDQLEGNKKVAAEVLGISLKTLYNRLNSYESARSGTA